MQTQTSTSLPLNKRQARLLYQLAQDCSTCRDQHDFERIARTSARELLPHASLIAALGRIDLEHLEMFLSGRDVLAADRASVATAWQQVRPSAERLKELGGAIEGKEAEIIPTLEIPLRLAPTPATKDLPGQTALTS